MKKLLFTMIALIGLVVVFSGCKQQSKSEEMQEAFEKAYAEAEQAPQTETQLFLGFQFGMNKKQLNSFLDSLVNAGKVYTDEQYAYKYDFKLSESLDLQISFIPKFENDSLYAITYFLSSEYNLGKEMEMMMMSFNQSERRNSFRGYYVDDIIGETSYHYIKDNMMITFRRNGLSSYMDYENVPIASRVKKEQKAKDDEVKKKSSEDF
ncbi:hypothetical protein [Porphyromonas cangingivalis]|uniref:Lipoprotein n=1 Tax=Porphyromonas cangingivalis TaxID=36874 RepID=A0A1T4KLZ0_PORCN|nr:hypothetical protein [Porphyromonas cangingivalis]SJZ43414.1 hypothetical protein SAMN02745205_00786 [Porphyromonas cangingivalis]VEJ02564.1 Uncharacterised protein [Porphyromonas cangingivalis]